ncbi:P-loop containing nucleoside triphosphate hydrolase protein [Pavlovales sp. CCMP2436]|nr:P-loop containing nucleoside triphosphate hydrolase protein [Pavlovales sp. CCMP2436]
MLLPPSPRRRALVRARSSPTARQPPSRCCAAVSRGSHHLANGLCVAAVRVTLRVRPMLPTDIADGASECVFTTLGEPCVFLGSDRAFTFDHVFGTRATQAEIYAGTQIGRTVRGALDGLNGTVFAYGQTGSGKTHTMGTAASFDADEGEESGILPRAMRELFDSLKARLETGELLQVRVSATFIEIHREEVRDLLHASGGALERDAARAGDPSGAISLAGARQRVLRSAADALKCVQAGVLSRATASTAMNATSSRSHAVLTLTVDADLTGQAGGQPHALSAKLHFVDLAGSERAKRTKAEGERLQEGIHINRGLLALGNVICALTAERKPGAHVHVPYRESKLTRLLQDSLGGNSQTLMLACVSPCDADFEETLNTLKYAHRARQIQNRPMVNQDLERADAAQLRLQVRALQAQLGSAATVGGPLRTPSGEGAGGAAGLSDAPKLLRRCTMLEAQAATLRAQLARAGAQIGQLHARALAAEAVAGEHGSALLAPAAGDARAQPVPGASDGSAAEPTATVLPGAGAFIYIYIYQIRSD